MQILRTRSLLAITIGLLLVALTTTQIASQSAGTGTTTPIKDPKEADSPTPGNTLPFPRPLTIVTKSLPDATVGEPYSFQLVASGGRPPYVWEISSGRLPLGLSMDRNGKISGKLERAAKLPVSFTVAVKDAAGSTVTKTLSIRVTGAPEMTMQWLEGDMSLAPHWYSSGCIVPLENGLGLIRLGYIENGPAAIGSDGSTILEKDYSVFISRYSGSGSVLWTRTISMSALAFWNDYLDMKLGADAMGNSYLAFAYRGSLGGNSEWDLWQFDTGSGVDELEDPWDPAIFVASYDVNGNLRWLHKVATIEDGYLTDHYDDGSSFTYPAFRAFINNVSLSPSGHCYVTFGCYSIWGTPVSLVIGQDSESQKTLPLSSSTSETVICRLTCDGEIEWSAHLSVPRTGSHGINVAHFTGSAVSDDAFVLGMDQWGYSFGALTLKVYSAHSVIPDIDYWRHTHDGYVEGVGTYVKFSAAGVVQWLGTVPINTHVAHRVLNISLVPNGDVKVGLVRRWQAIDYYNSFVVYTPGVVGEACSLGMPQGNSMVTVASDGSRLSSNMIVGEIGYGYHSLDPYSGMDTIESSICMRSDGKYYMQGFCCPFYNPAVLDYFALDLETKVYLQGFNFEFIALCSEEGTILDQVIFIWQLPEGMPSPSYFFPVAQFNRIVSADDDKIIFSGIAQAFLICGVGEPWLQSVNLYSSEQYYPHPFLGMITLSSGLFSSQDLQVK